MSWWVAGATVVGTIGGSLISADAQKDMNQDRINAMGDMAGDQSVDSWLRDYLGVITDPSINQKLLSSEQRYRPKWTELGLQDQYNQLFGFGGQGVAGQGTGTQLTDIQREDLEKEIADLQNIVDLQGSDLGASALENFHSRIAEKQAQLDAGVTGTTGTAQGGTPGQLDMLGMMTPILGDIQADALTQQRTSDIEDVEALGSRATEALRASDPAMQELIGQQQGQVADAFGRSPTSTVGDQQRVAGMEQNVLGLQDQYEPQKEALDWQAHITRHKAQEYDQGLSAQQERQAEQQAREAAGARGVEGSNAAIASEILNREGFLRQNREEARTMRDEARGFRQESLGLDFVQQGLRGEAAGLRGEQSALRREGEGYRANAFQEGQQAGGNLFNMLGSTSADPFQSILGRPSGAFGAAQGQYGMGAGLAASGMGPQLYDPNAGINIGLQQQGNMLNYQAALAGADASQSAGMMGMLGSLGGAFISSYPWGGTGG